MDFSQVCRSCLKELSLVDKGNINNNIIQMFYACTQIKIAEQDILPKQFCHECIKNLDLSYTYISNAQKVDVALKNIVNRNKPSVIVEPGNLNKAVYTHIQSTEVHADDIQSTEANEDQPVLGAHVLIDNINDDFDESFEDIVVQCNNAASTDLEDHKLSNSDKIKNVCPTCKKTFASKTWFQKHLKNNHSGQKHICPHCQKAFTQQGQLTNHLTVHSDERNFVCDTCGKRFKRKKDIAVHVQAHGEARPYKCVECTMSFKKLSVLQSHMKVHREKPFLCSYCGWSFAQASNLSTHMRVHTGEKPFACAHCPFRAAAAAGLRAHLDRHSRTLHRCQHCGKLLADIGSLTRHIRIHTGERPYQCGECPLSFLDSWKLKLHLMRVHRRKLTEIPRARMRHKLTITTADKQM